MTTDSRVYCDTQAANLAQETFEAYTRDIWILQYVWLVPGDKGNKLVLAPDCPPGGTLAINEAMPRNMERYQMANWLRPKLYVLPILPKEDE
jgi:hypothetical protein